MRCWRCDCEIFDENLRNCMQCGARLVAGDDDPDEDVFDADELGVDPFPED